MELILGDDQVIEGRTHRPIIEKSKCEGCGFCGLQCPELAIICDKDKKKAIIDLKYCKACGICTYICPKKAIKLILEKKIKRK
jgi:pyruvate ferredoxin oxidoreductase delta subunit